jgi:hypothetical protein
MAQGFTKVGGCGTYGGSASEPEVAVLRVRVLSIGFASLKSFIYPLHHCKTQWELRLWILSLQVEFLRWILN